MADISVRAPIPKLTASSKFPIVSDLDHKFSGLNMPSKRFTSSCISLNINYLIRNGGLEEGLSSEIVWARGRKSEQRIKLVALENGVQLRYSVGKDSGETRHIAEDIALTWSKVGTSNRRPWFKCPGCGRSVAILYAVGKFRCRHCHQLAYKPSPNLLHERLGRKLRRLRRRLGDEAGNGFDPVPPRPKGMHHATYETLSSQYLELQDDWMSAVEDWADEALARCGVG